MDWTVETLHDGVDAELSELPVDMLARFVYITELIEESVLEIVREPRSSTCAARSRNCVSKGAIGFCERFPGRQSA